MGIPLEIGVSSHIIMKLFICLSALVGTKRGFRNIALEGFSEDANQDGFVDPIGQVAPVVYAAPVVAPYAYHHVAPVTYTHTVAAGSLFHPFGFGLPVVAPAAAAPAEEAVVEA